MITATGARVIQSTAAARQYLTSLTTEQSAAAATAVAINATRPAALQTSTVSATE